MSIISDQPDWNARREIIRTLVKRIEIDTRWVRIVYRVLPDPNPGQAISQHSCSRVGSALETSAQSSRVIASSSVAAPSLTTHEKV